MFKHVSGVAETVALEFAAEETHFGSSANIIICARTYPLGGRRKNYVEIVTLDLQTGGSNTVLVTRAPSARDVNSYCNPAICGGLAACRQELPSQLVLIQRHVLIKTSSQIHVITNIRLDPYWKLTLDIGAPLEFSVVPATNLPTFSMLVDPATEQSFKHLYVHESPIRDDTYRVWIRGPTHAPYIERLLRCQLSIPIHGAPNWRGGTQSFVVSSPYRVIPYSGHTLLQTKPETPPRVYTMCPPTSSAVCTWCAPARVEVPFCGEYQDVAPYSGAITYCMRSSIVIKYYE
ncbi:hypothetical protein B0H13DRAFT_2469083 [Mycena leptocephala]|nr:hypothetical protein B0H13DRAFT_2469083 [Mycena leptocephala]